MKLCLVRQPSVEPFIVGKVMDLIARLDVVQGSIKLKERFKPGIGDLT